MPGLTWTVIKRWHRPTATAMALILSCAIFSGCTVADTEEEPLNASAPDAEATDAGRESSLRLPAIRLTNRPVVPIASLMTDNVDETVAISGQVAQKVSMLDGWLYQVEDETGSLWVLSDRTAPTIGESATVEGIVRYEAIVVDEFDAGEVYLEEKFYREGER
ncbi:MAG: hypothetical protein AAFU53_01805 [Cyanobacteria bacterium J06632_3]